MHNKGRFDLTECVCRRHYGRPCVRLHRWESYNLLRHAAGRRPDGEWYLINYIIDWKHDCYHFLQPDSKS